MSLKQTQFVVYQSQRISNLFGFEKATNSNLSDDTPKEYRRSSIIIPLVGYLALLVTIPDLLNMIS